MSATIKITRKKLFDDLWELGYERSAEEYEVSLNELLQVYKDNNIPKPYESYFADKHTGKALQIPELPGDENEEIELQQVWKRRKKVDSTLGSKANAICILQTLKDHSDENKALSVFDIIRFLEKNYQLTVDRRTVYKTIELLSDLGYDIEVDKKGSKNYYALLEKTLDPSEVKIIMDSLMLNPLLSPKISDEINNKINKYLAKRTPLQRTWYWHSHDKFIEKYDTDSLLYSYLDEIDAALMQGKKLEFDYLKYDTNGNKVPYRDKKFVVSPYMIKIHNFTYYLFCSGDTDEEAEFRIDRMVNVRMLDENSNGKRVAGKAGVVGAYNYGGNAQFPVTMKCDNELLEKITDDFANQLKHIELKDNNDGKTFTATIYGNAYRLATWAAGVADKCEVVEPQEVRDLVIDKIKNNKYGV